MKQPKRGFTLVEVMIVVAIIAILVAMAIPHLLRYRVAANESAARATLKSISNALENYSSINHIFPPNTTTLIGATPPYLNKDYFSGVHQGYTYTATVSSYTYSVTAVPVSATQGTASFTISTTGVLSTN